jgi:hypothetical protein
MKSSRKRGTRFKELRGTTNEIISQIKRLVKKGNARRLMIQNKKGKILFQTQLTAGLTGSALLLFMAPVISILGAGALAMNKVKVVVEKYPDEQIEGDKGKRIVEVKDEDETDKTIGRKNSDQ